MLQIYFIDLQLKATFKVCLHHLTKRVNMQQAVLYVSRNLHSQEQYFRYFLKLDISLNKSE